MLIQERDYTSHPGTKGEHFGKMRQSSNSNKIGDRIDQNLTEQQKFRLKTGSNEEAKAQKFEKETEKRMKRQKAKN